MQRLFAQDPRADTVKGILLGARSGASQPSRPWCAEKRSLAGSNADRHRRTMRWATRRASVLVLLDPASAGISSGLSIRPSGQPDTVNDRFALPLI